MANWPGLLSVGNLDIYNRPIVHNADGSISTVLSITIESDGIFVLLPTVLPNPARIVSNADAISYYLATGENLGKFDSEAHAEAYATALHNQQADYYSNPQINHAPLYLIPKSATLLEFLVSGSKGEISTDGTTWSFLNRSQGIGSVGWAPELGQILSATLANSGRFATSTDGVTWIQHDSNLTGAPNQVVKPVWSGSMWLVGGPSGQFTRSFDGFNWQRIVSAFSPVTIGAYCWNSDTGIWLAVDDNARVGTSSDGINWTLNGAMLQHFDNFPPAERPLQPFSAVWVHELGIYVVVGAGGSNWPNVYTSPDGLNWTERPTPDDVNIRNARQVIWVKEMGLLVTTLDAGQFTGPFTPPAVATSPDGANWTTHSIGFSAGSFGTTGCYDVAWSPSLHMAVCVGGGFVGASVPTPQVAYSNDLLNWTLGTIVSEANPFNNDISWGSIVWTNPLVIPTDDTPPGSGGTGTTLRPKNIPLGILGASLVKRQQRSGPN